jgi:hypothetical protein
MRDRRAFPTELRIGDPGTKEIEGSAEDDRNAQDLFKGFPGKCNN